MTAASAGGKFGADWSASLRRGSDAELRGWVEAALGWCDAADEIALRHFRQHPVTTRKPDRTFVTEADTAIERLLRERIADAFPDHGIVGEEFGADGDGASVRWFVDPIDGTHNYLRGVPIFATLLGVDRDGELQAGIISAPDFNRYQLELAPVGQDTFAIISPVNTSQVPNNGTLLQWNTTTVPNGIYRLRLAAFANNGGFIYKIVQIGVNNLAVVPTSPPIVLPTAANVTPIPFETPLVFPTAQATLAPAVQIQIGPTVTPGIIPLGGLAPLSTPTP